MILIHFAAKLSRTFQISRYPIFLIGEVEVPIRMAWSFTIWQGIILSINRRTMNTYFL